MLVERSNLVNVAKLCIKNLIESALAESRTLDDEHVPLQQLFVVMEHIFSHGLKCKRFGARLRYILFNEMRGDTTWEWV